MGWMEVRMRSASRTINRQNTSQIDAMILHLFGISRCASSVWPFCWTKLPQANDAHAHKHIKQLSTKRKQQIANSGKSFFILVFGVLSSILIFHGSFGRCAWRRRRVKWQYKRCAIARCRQLVPFGETVQTHTHTRYFTHREYCTGTHMEGS